MPKQPTNRSGMSRRDLLRRLGLGIGVAYVAPGVLIVSSSSAVAGSSTPTQPSKPNGTGSRNGRSNRNDDEDDSPNDHCKSPGAASAELSPKIRRGDIERAQESVDAGYAKPLNEIWRDILSAYDGRIVEIEFTGFKTRPRFRMRAVSPTGRLETVIVSARTGKIERIVGC